MLNKEQNDSPGWKNKLEAGEGLQGETIVDKQAAWEKLQDRLQEKPRSNKAIWYWAAAAAILLILMIPVLIKSNKENNLPENVVVTGQPKKIVSPSLPVVTNDAVPLVQISNNEKKPVLTINTVNAKQQVAVAVIAKENNQHNVVAETAVETKKEEIIIATLLPDTAAAIAAVVPSPKKMKIVHINDLETFPLPFYSSGNQAQKAFKIKIGTSSNNQGTTPAQEYTSAMQLKIPFKN